MMQVEVITRETIKPSSPTPLHKSTFKLSLIDKVMPPIYLKLITYYSSAQTKNIQDLDQTLKDSLSKALTIFYPFAGRVNDDFTIDCNDSGVLFVTTSVDCGLVDVLTSPKPRIESFGQFVPPLPPLCPDGSNKPSLVAFQLNKFTCGGIAISFCFCHLLIDAITNAMFAKCWSEIAAKVESATNYIIYPAMLLYPQGSTDDEAVKNLLGAMGNMVRRDDEPLSTGGTIRRFNFENWAISKIKNNLTSEHVPIPTRVEALTSFIWKHMMLASEVVKGYKQPSALLQAVDLRRRMPLGIVPTGLSVGNVVWLTAALYRNTAASNDDAEVEKELGSSIRQSFNKIKDNFIPKLFSIGAYDTVRESLEGLQEIISDENLNAFQFSSWHKIGFADTNFGWGKPIWVSLIGGDVDSLQSNIVFLIDGGSDTIDAWVTLDKKQMEILENNQEFLAFALSNPPVRANSI